MSMSEADLNAIEARCQAATAGPWTVLSPDDDLSMNARVVVQEAKAADIGDRGYGWQYAVALTAHQVEPFVGIGLCDADTEPWRYMEENPAFIAHSREDVPALLVEVRELRALAGELAEMIVELGNEMAHEGMGSYVPANRLLAGARAAGVLA